MAGASCFHHHLVPAFIPASVIASATSSGAAASKSRLSLTGRCRDAVAHGMVAALALVPHPQPRRMSRVEEIAVGGRTLRRPGCRWPAARAAPRSMGWAQSGSGASPPRSSRPTRAAPCRAALRSFCLWQSSVCCIDRLNPHPIADLPIDGSARMKSTFPFVPKSTTPLQRGQFWSIPLVDGRFGADCVLGEHLKDGKPSTRIFLAGVVRWIGTRPPTASDLAGCDVLRFGFAHILTVTTTGGSILGVADLRLADLPDAVEATEVDAWGTTLRPVSRRSTRRKLQVRR